MRKVIIGILIVVVLIATAFGVGVCSFLLKTSNLPYRGDIGLIKLEGEIFTADKFLKKLEDARKDSSVKAVVLRIDSPGGAVAASQEMFEEVKKLNETKPVIVSMGDIAASGGYYVACGGRKIFANAATITGSIGVRMEHINIGDLVAFAKVSHETLKSGHFKDMGAIDRKMTDEEKALFNELLVNLHKQFKTAVSASRGIPLEKVDEIADGRVYTGEQALPLGLIDELGTQNSAIKYAANLVGIKGEPDVKEFEEETSLLERIFDIGANTVKNNFKEVKILY